MFTCPCGGTRFLEGPHGGLAINFCCAACGRRFNDTLFAIEELEADGDERETFRDTGFQPRTQHGLPIACKALVTVTAGVLSDEAVADYSRQWSYNSDHWEIDRKRPPYEMTTFQSMLKAAYIYAESITDPARVNWVRVEFMWM